MQQRLREVAIVREQENAAGLEVETPHGEHALRDAVQQVFHGSTTFGIVHRRDYAARFVQQEINRMLGDQALAVDLDTVARGVRARAKLSHDAPVDAHPALGDQLFGCATRGHASPRENLLQTFGAHDWR
jgi:hypothetical protein